jgi:3',5'-nucleoside bisphosphate phosphatase
MKNVDLHTHSYYSDGELSPKEVVIRAKKKGVKILALTDHNSLEGVEEAIKEGEVQGIKIIPSIEIRAEEDEVLGYFIDNKNIKFKKELEKIQNNLVNRVKKIIKKLNKKEIKINFKDLLKKYSPNKNLMEIHLVKYLKSKGLGGVGELWSKYISKKGETYVSVKEISVIDAIKMIKKYGGIPVLAHPWVESSSKELLKENKFKKLVKAGLKGIEADNGDRDERRDKKTINRIKELSSKYNLIITSGSDFHSTSLVESTGSHEIGKHNCDEKVIKSFLKIIEENKK